MSRKPKKGYYVRGEFVAEGSELDLELKRELKGTSEASRTELKRESEELQKLGADLLTLRADLLDALDLPEKLLEALADAKRITNFEGKRRQLQFIGKLMRKLESDTLEAARAALQAQHQGSARETLALHRAEQWRDRLITQDDAIGDWLRAFPGTDGQQLRALVRQARKDVPPLDKGAVSQGLAPRHGRAFREVFQLVREQLAAADAETASTAAEDHPAEDDGGP